MGCRCSQSLCLCFVICGVQSSCKAKSIVCVIWVLYVYTRSTIACCVLCWAICKDVGPGFLGVALLKVFQGDRFPHQIILRVFGTYSWYAAFDKEMSFFALGRDLRALGNLLGGLFEDVSVSLFKASALVDKVFPL